MVSDQLRLTTRNFYSRQRQQKRPMPKKVNTDVILSLQTRRPADPPIVANANVNVKGNENAKKAAKQNGQLVELELVLAKRSARAPASWGLR